MLFRSNPASGVPVYLQLIEQVKHAIDIGALRPGDQLPAIRRVALREYERRSRCCRPRWSD